MEGANESTELRRHPYAIVLAIELSRSVFETRQENEVGKKVFS